MELCINSLKLGEKPLVAGVATDSDVLTLDAELLSPPDILELRVDMFENTEISHVETIFKMVLGKLRKPIIATIRDVSEGGQRQFADKRELFRTLAPLAAIIDTEISDEGTMKYVKDLCTSHGKLLIGSYHNFSDTPEDSFLEEVIFKGMALGADIVKIAVTPKDRDDLVRTLLLTVKHRDKALITISMGDKGLPSRILGPVFGSLITYGFVSRPSAPGQVSVSELLHILRRLKVR
jgi:3-dehydroquinate dehydratase type I